MAKETKEVATTEEGQVIDLELFEGPNTGFEGTDAQTFKTPFLKVLQKQSPELDKDDPKYIEGAEVGDFCNSATQELRKEMNIIILKIEHTIIVWKPERGGFVGRYPKSMEDEVVTAREGMEKWDNEGNIVMDTIELYCINADDSSDMFIFPLSGASVKHGRSFATRLRMLKSAGKLVKVSWAGVWNIKTIKESNDKGSWYTLGSTPEFIRFITKEEKNASILPAKEILKVAETDYTILEGGEDKVDENVGF